MSIGLQFHGSQKLIVQMAMVGALAINDGQSYGKSKIKLKKKNF